MNTAPKDLGDLQQQMGSTGLCAAVEQHRREIFNTPLPHQPQFSTPPSVAGIEERPLPDIVSIDTLLKADLVQPPEIISGVLHKGSKMVLGGGSKSYKTFSLLDLGLSVAAGVPWWGFDTTKTSVLYVNLEIGDYFFAQRIKAIINAKDEVNGVKDFDMLNLRGHAGAFQKIRPKIYAKAGQKYGLIIIDPIYKVFGDRDENSASDMGDLLSEMDKLAVDTGAAVVFGAHFSKGNQAKKESIDRMSGSGVFARDPDSILIMTKHKDDGVFTVDSTLRNFTPIQPFCVKWKHPLMERDRLSNPSQLKQTSGRATAFTSDQLLEVLGANNFTSKEWKNACIAKLGMSERMYYDLLKILKEDKQVDYCKDDKTYIAVTLD